MIVDLQGHSLEAVRERLAYVLYKTEAKEVRTLEALLDAPRKHKRTKRQDELERKRMRQKVAGTKKVRAALEDVWDRLRIAVLGKAGFTEDDSQDSVSRIRHLLDALDSVDTTVVTSAMATELASIYAQAVTECKYELGVSFDLQPTGALYALAHHELTFSRKVIDRERNAIKQMLMAALSAGDSTQTLGAKLRDYFDDGIHIVGASGAVERVMPLDSWAELVARTEVGRAYTQGTFDTYRQARVQAYTFLSAEDERVCAQCDALDGQTFPITDTEDAPLQHAGCRCTSVAAELE